MKKSLVLLTTILTVFVLIISSHTAVSVNAYSTIYTNDPGLYQTFDSMIQQMQATGSFVIPTRDGTQASIIYAKFRLYFLGQLPYRYRYMYTRNGFTVTPQASLEQLRAECANHYTAKAIIDAFAAETSALSYEDKVNFYTNYLCTYVTYDHAGLSAEKQGFGLASRSVYSLFATQTGVCEAYAKAFYALCAASGIQVRYVEGYSGGPHAWNEIFIPDSGNGTVPGWYEYDITYQDSGLNAIKRPVSYNNQGGV